jgi:hypothetical protein
MLLLDGKQLSYDRPFTHNGIQYPANWLRLTSWAEKEAIGITEVPDPAPVDTRFYWDHDLPKRLEDEPAVDENDDPVLDENGVQVINTGLKTQWKLQQDQTAYTLLAPTDWYVVRKSEVGTDIPVGISSFRADVRTVCEGRKDAIGLATDVPSLVGIVTFYGLDWPTLNN